MLEMGVGEGMNRVHTSVLPSRSRRGRMFSRLPLAMITSIPSSATLRAMWLLVVMPPRPNDERPDWMYCDSSSPGRTSVMTRLPGSPGVPL